MSRCNIEYDLLTSSIGNWWLPALGPVFFGAALLFYLIGRSVERKPMTPFRRFTLVSPIYASIVWTGAAFAWACNEYYQFSHVYQQGKYREISGKIENVAGAGHEQRRGYERFEVGGVQFSYSNSLSSPGFHKTRAFGGPIRDGLLVRVRYIDGAIVRLEICGEGSGGGD